MLILVMDILSWFVFELHLTDAMCILQVLVWTSLMQQHKMCVKDVLYDHNDKSLPHKMLFAMKDIFTG